MTRVPTSPWALAVAIVVWTGIAWGGRIGLLEGGEDVWALVRIAGSFVVGAAAAAALLLPAAPSWRRAALYVFATWTVVLWSRSLVVNWIGSGSLAFKLVHTALGAGFFALALWSLSTARHQPASGRGRDAGEQRGSKTSDASER